MSDRLTDGETAGRPKIKVTAWGLCNSRGKMIQTYVTDYHDNLVGAFAFGKESDAKSIALSDESVREVVIMDLETWERVSDDARRWNEECRTAEYYQRNAKALDVHTRKREHHDES